MKDSETKNLIVYEYIALNVSANIERLYIDTFECFGYDLLNNIALIDKDDYYLNNIDASHRTIRLRFRRPRNIDNKSRLNALEKDLRNILKRIEKLENEPEIKAIILALTVGLIGLASIAVSLIVIRNIDILYILCMIIGIVGLISPYFIYTNTIVSIEKKNAKELESLYETTQEICLQAQKLIEENRGKEGRR